MAAKKTYRILRIALAVVLLAVACAGGYIIWLGHNYKSLAMERLPKAVAEATDSVYHISFTDIDISIIHHSITLTGVELWPDPKQVAVLKLQNRQAPSTLSTVSVPKLEVYGIVWGDLLKKKSLNSKNIVVRDLKWLMVCHPDGGDSLAATDKKKTPRIERVSAERADFINPDITYEYKGPKTSFSSHMKGGTAVLNDWAYNYDDKIDTSVFLYARDGNLRFEQFVLSKPSGRYTIKTPSLDFATTANTVTLKAVKIKNMAYNDPNTGKEKDNYNLDLPEIELVDFNWNRLINGGELVVPAMHAASPRIDVRYMSENDTRGGKKGGFPNQLLLEVGLKTNIKSLEISKGRYKYTIVTRKGNEGIIEFTGINGKMTNITNIPHVIATDKTCVVRLQGKFMGKSDVTANFDLSLANNKGGFRVNGTLDNVNGDEVNQQAQAFTFVKVTSFHLNHMDMHIEGDETYEKGNFTVLYQDLKISVFKFDSKQRDGKKGPLAFLGSTLVLYPSNPMPGEDVRKTTTSFARDTTKGFVGMLWQSIYRAAKKTAVREPGLITVTDAPETDKGEQPKKGFFRRLFGRKK